MIGCQNQTPDALDGCPRQFQGRERLARKPGAGGLVVGNFRIVNGVVKPESQGDFVPIQTAGRLGVEFHQAFLDVAKIVIVPDGFAMEEKQFFPNRLG